MVTIGCDHHPGSQQGACVDTDTGELGEHRLVHRERKQKADRQDAQLLPSVRRSSRLLPFSTRSSHGE